MQELDVWGNVHSSSPPSAPGLRPQSGSVTERRRAVPAYFYPLLSRQDALAPGADLLDAVDRAFVASYPILVYLHVPFCRDHCRFCGFYRLPAPRGSDGLARYVERVLHEAGVWGRSGLLDGARIPALYIGGGTPSLLGPDGITRLLSGLRDHLPLEEGAEISFEGEARSLADPARLEALRAAGVTRVSFGVQSFHPEVRRLAGIGASLGDVEQCAARVKAHGFKVCLDLMYGLPGQSVEIFAEDLRTAVEGLGAALVDLYELVLYPNSPLTLGPYECRARIPRDADRRSMYGVALDYFAARGYRSWTLEDFCLQGSEYRMKQLTYGAEQGQAQTLALGACAVGYLGGCAYRNRMLEDYLASPEHRLPVALLRRASTEELRRRPLFFYPRRLELDPRRLPWPLTDEEHALLAHQAECGLSRQDASGRWILSRKGRLNADEMVQQFLSGAECRKLFKLVQ